MDQLCCKLGQSLDPPACKSIFDVDVLPLDVTKITQPLTEGVDFRRGSGRAVMQETDPRDFRWLRMRCEGPRRRAADSRDELATFHGSPYPGREPEPYHAVTPDYASVQCGKFGHRMAETGQKRKGSQRAYSIRFTPKSRHRRCA